MPLSVWYWVCIFLWIVFGCWSGYVSPVPDRPRTIGFSVLVFLLFLIIGLRLFGSPVTGG
jgi:hypothetical protein